ncbi:MAG: hypothetical protein JWN99_1524, partial [Ilumatobacteraceae bacterium]|nr:hypothetical protein [Ilumatobacteraceae bacterium]
LGLARGGSPRAAVAVAGVAIAATIASAGLVHSFDRVEQHPARYGAWWDLVVGDYSDADALNQGAGKIREDPSVSAAAVYGNFEATINGQLVELDSISPLVGEAPSTIVEGRSPVSSSEIALGQTLAKNIHVHIGDTVTVKPTDDQGTSTKLTVVGLAVLENPTSLDVGPGDGALVVQGTTGSIQDVVGQSILVRFDPSTDVAADRVRVMDGFRSFVSSPTPQSDLSNLHRIESVPWYIAGLLALLALATFVHAMITVLRRRRGELAVLAAIGMTRRQLRLVAMTAGIVLIVAASILGLVVGVIGGRALWLIVADRIGLSSGPVVGAGPIVLVLAVAVASATIIAGLAQARAPSGSDRIVDQ